MFVALLPPHNTIPNCDAALFTASDHLQAQYLQKSAMLQNTAIATSESNV
jgi:thiazole synthase ThiGH ThiG subunit